MFIFKKIVANLFFPLTFCFIILLTGLFMLWFTQKKRAGKIIVSLGIILLLVLGYAPFSDTLLRSLEHRYPPLLDIAPVSAIKWVIVLGGGNTSDPKLPITSRLSQASLVRLAEGIKIHSQLKNSKLLLSGSGVFESESNAEAMAAMASHMGVDKKNMVLESLSRDTKDQARLIQGIVKKERFILVTSASHMPRSMMLFQKLDMQPIPAPTDFTANKRQGLNPSMFFPSTNNLAKVQVIIYEYLGIAWSTLRGQV